MKCARARPVYKEREEGKREQLDLIVKVVVVVVVAARRREKEREGEGERVKGCKKLG